MKFDLKNFKWKNGLAKTKEKELERIRKVSDAMKTKHNSPTTEIKKRQHLSPETEFKQGQHPHTKTEFKKGQKAWNKGKPHLGGEKHHNWMGGRTHRTNQWKWTKLRQKIWGRDNHTCQLCSKINSKLNAHHIIPYRISKDNSPSNLITICDSCHMKIENQIIKILKGGELWDSKKQAIQQLVVCH